MERGSGGESEGEMQAASLRRKAVAAQQRRAATRRGQQVPASLSKDESDADASDVLVDRDSMSEDETSVAAARDNNEVEKAEDYIKEPAAKESGMKGQKKKRKKHKHKKKHKKHKKKHKRADKDAGAIVAEPDKMELAEDADNGDDAADDVSDGAGSVHSPTASSKRRTPHEALENELRRQALRSMSKDE